MASQSPLPDNKVGEPAAVNGATTPQRLIALDIPKQSQRGHNKPRCIKCGNVARSRCPFQSCKNCCAKAQNPCHVHVLKQGSILPAQPPPTTTVPEQPSPDVPSAGSSWRLSSLKQLSAAFANTMRVKKPLTLKDAVNINKWRFSKLKEHIEGDIEAENEAFDRYMWIVRLLDETFSTEGFVRYDPNASEPTSEDEFQKLVASMKLRRRSNAEKADSFRERTKDLVEELLRKLQEKEPVPDESALCADELDAGKPAKRRKKGEWRAERTTAFNDLIEKLSKARSEDDLKLCLELKHQLAHRSESCSADSSAELGPEKSPTPKQELDTTKSLFVYTLPKMWTAVDMDQDSLSNISVELSFVNQLAEL